MEPHNPLSNTFPDDFIFGVATASYQIEGAWNEDGKSESIWDHVTHNHPEIIADQSNGDVACDSYHKIEEDVRLLKDMGVHFYRFSLAWTRILPSPLTNNVNKSGIQYYNRLIDLLLENSIQPMVTLFHWDLPQSLHELGGFTNSLTIDAFVNYAKVVFENFGDRVKFWTTFNEPNIYCIFGYGDGILAPLIKQSGIADYLCAHNILLAHAKTYHLYKNEFGPTQNGKISINFNSPWPEPASQTPENIAAANRYIQFLMGWFAHPIFSTTGDYPKTMKEEIAKRSKGEGFVRSRLPSFTQTEIDLIKGTCDFLALNHYNTFLINDKGSEIYGDPSYRKDLNASSSVDPNWPGTASSLNKVVPWGLTKLLVWIKENYGNPEIIITESGFSDYGDLNDSRRIEYYRYYLNAVLKAMNEHGVRVTGYTAWSFLDNFEWIEGYKVKFGLYQVDFSNPSRPRTSKASANYYKQVIRTRKP